MKTFKFEADAVYYAKKEAVRSYMLNTGITLTGSEAKDLINDLDKWSRDDFRMVCCWLPSYRICMTLLIGTSTYDGHAGVCEMCGLHYIFSD